MSEDTQTAPTETAPPQTSWTVDQLATTPVISLLKDEVLRRDPTLARFQNFPDLAQAYVSLRKMQGADPGSFVALPSEDTAEAWAPVYNKLGRPEKSDGYVLPDVNDPRMKALNLDAGMLKTVSEAAHTSGASQKALTGIIEAYVGAQEANQQQMAAALSAELETGRKELQTQWGAAYEQNVSRAEAALKLLDEPGKIPGVTEWLTANGLEGDPMMQRLLYQIGANIKEVPLIEGRGASEILSPDMATAEIARLMADKQFLAERKDKHNPMHGQRLAQLARLHQLKSGQRAA